MGLAGSDLVDDRLIDSLGQFALGCRRGLRFEQPDS